MMIPTSLYHRICISIIHIIFIINQSRLFTDYCSMPAQVKQRGETTFQIITFEFGIVINKCDGSSQFVVPKGIRVVCKKCSLHSEGCTHLIHANHYDMHSFVTIIINTFLTINRKIPLYLQSTLLALWINGIIIYQYLLCPYLMDIKWQEIYVLV